MSLPVESYGRLAGAALGGFGVWQVVSMYQNTAPKLSTLRASDAGDTTVRQNLVDANVLSGVLAVGAGVLASFAAQSMLPLLVIVAVWGYMAAAHWRVLLGAST